MYVVAMCLGETLPILHIDGRRRSMNVNYMFRLLVDQSSQPNRSIEGSLVAQGLHTVVAKKRNDGDDEIQNVCVYCSSTYISLFLLTVVTILSCRVRTERNHSDVPLNL